MASFAIGKCIGNKLSSFTIAAATPLPVHFGVSNFSTTITNSSSKVPIRKACTIFFSVINGVTGVPGVTSKAGYHSAAVGYHVGSPNMFHDPIVSFRNHLLNVYTGKIDSSSQPFHRSASVLASSMSSFSTIVADNCSDVGHAWIKPPNSCLSKPPLAKRVLIVGSGGLSIGQAGEFDYSGKMRGILGGKKEI